MINSILEIQSTLIHESVPNVGWYELAKGLGAGIINLPSGTPNPVISISSTGPLYPFMTIGTSRSLLSIFSAAPQAGLGAPEIPLSCIEDAPIGTTLILNFANGGTVTYNFGCSTFPQGTSAPIQTFPVVLPFSGSNPSPTSVNVSPGDTWVLTRTAAMGPTANGWTVVTTKP